MKYLKCFIILAIALMLSGCKVNSEVTVNYDGTVSETNTVLASTSIMGNNKSDVESYVNAGIDSFRDVLSLRKYKSEVIYNEGSDSGAKLSNSYSNICEYVERNLFSQYLYDHVSCTEVDGYYEIKNETPHIDYCGDCNDWPALDSVEVKINLPVSAAENNADEVSDKTYVWRYDENTPDYKSLYLKISKNALEENKEKEIKKKNTKKTLGTAVSVVIVLAIIGALLFVCYTLYKKYQANKLDY